MAGSKALLPLLLVVTITGLLESVNGFNGSPTITSTTLSEVIVNPGENYTITCESDTPIIWEYTSSPDSEPKIHSPCKNGRYISSIQLTNITYKDVGYYYCLLKNNSMANSSIYLFVNDTENLLIHDERSFVPITGIQYQEIIIPCKPTHPGVKTTLCRNGDEKLLIGENDILGVIRYDQKVGFILENAQAIQNGYYICCILPGGLCSQECPRAFSFEVLKHADYVARPAIDETNLQHVKVGENVTMECAVTVPSSTKYKLDWIVPNQQSDRIKIEGTVVEPPTRPVHHLAIGKKKLKIVNAELEDSGNYTCKVTDHAGNTNSETIYLKIFGNTKQEKSKDTPYSSLWDIL